MISDSHQGRGDGNVTPALIADLKELADKLEITHIWSAVALDEVLDKHGY